MWLNFFTVTERKVSLVPMNLTSLLQNERVQTDSQQVKVIPGFTEWSNMTIFSILKGCFLGFLSEHVLNQMWESRPTCSASSVNENSEELCIRCLKATKFLQNANAETRAFLFQAISPCCHSYFIIVLMSGDTTFNCALLPRTHPSNLPLSYLQCHSAIRDLLSPLASMQLLFTGLEWQRSQHEHSSAESGEKRQANYQLMDHRALISKSPICL